MDDMDEQSRETMENPVLLITRLLEAIRAGDSGRQGEILRQYEPWLNLLARVHMETQFQGKFDASDIVQQTFLEAYRKLPDFRGRSEGELIAWLRTILGNVVRQEVRKISISGLRASSLSRPDDVFGRPTSSVSCRSCRCRLVSSTRSKSANPSVPTPAAARYMAAGDPRPPAPTTSTRAAWSRRCPSRPTSGRRRCRLYRASSGPERPSPSASAA